MQPGFVNTAFQVSPGPAEVMQSRSGVEFRNSGNSAVGVVSQVTPSLTAADKKAPEQNATREPAFIGVYTHYSKREVDATRIFSNPGLSQAHLVIRKPLDLSWYARARTSASNSQAPAAEKSVWLPHGGSCLCLNLANSSSDSSPRLEYPAGNLLLHASCHASFARQETFPPCLATASTRFRTCIFSQMFLT